MTRNANQRTPSSSGANNLQLVVLLIQLLIVCFLTFFSLSSQTTSNFPPPNSPIESSLQTSIQRPDRVLRPVATDINQHANGEPNTNDRWKKLDKFVNQYNYTAPWQSFKVAEECGAAPEFEDFFRQTDKRRSLLGEDKIIYENLFSNMAGKKGTYVELGAYDGVKESNSRFFDICLGWKGLLIEGNPPVFEQCRQNRPQAHRMSYSPSCKEDGHVQFHAATWTNSGLEGKARAYEGTETISVPCGPLGPVLEEIFRPEGGRITFLSLDVEGAEPAVLETIDFAKVQIDVMMVEVEDVFCKLDNQCDRRDLSREIMKKAGYRRYRGVTPFSDLYIHPNSPYQLKGPLPPSWKES